MTGQSDPLASTRQRKPERILSDPVLMDLSHKLGYIVPAMPDYIITS
jgi:hypothetical protein